MNAKQNPTRPPSTKEELALAWKDRLIDARILYSNNRYQAAVTSGVYSLEILLKSRICSLLDWEALPANLEVHDLIQLLHFSGLERRLKENDEIRLAWNAILSRSEDVNNLRYGKMQADQGQACEFFRHLGRNPMARWKSLSTGVITWITEQR